MAGQTTTTYGIHVSPAYIPSRNDIAQKYLPGSYARLTSEDKELVDLIVKLYQEEDPDGRIRKCLRWGGIKLAKARGGREMVPLYLVAQAKSRGGVRVRDVDWFRLYARNVVDQRIMTRSANANLLMGEDIESIDLHPDPQNLSLEEQDVLQFCLQLFEERAEKGYSEAVLKRFFLNMVIVQRASNGLRVSAPGYYAAAKLGLTNKTDLETLKARVQCYQIQPNTLQGVDSQSRLGANIIMTADGRFQVDPSEELQTQIRELKEGESLEDQFTYRLTDDQGNPMKVTVTLNYGPLGEASQAES